MDWLSVGKSYAAPPASAASAAAGAALQQQVSVRRSPERKSKHRSSQKSESSKRSHKDKKRHKQKHAKRSSSTRSASPERKTSRKRPRPDCSDSASNLDSSSDDDDDRTIAERMMAPAAPHYAQSKSQASTITWTIDRKGDPATLQSGGFYKHSVPSYYRPKSFQRRPGTSSRTADNRASAAASRYFSPEARATARAEAKKGLLQMWKHPQQQQQSDADSSEPALAYIPLTESSTTKGADALAAELAEADTPEHVLMRRTKEFNECTRAAPGDVQLWLRYVDLQETAVTSSTSTSSSAVAAAIAERKLGILERALRVNESSVPLRLAQLDAAAAAGASDEALERLYRKALAKCIQPLCVWRGLIAHSEHRFAAFTVPDQRDLIATGLAALASTLAAPTPQQQQRQRAAAAAAATASRAAGIVRAAAAAAAGAQTAAQLAAAVDCARVALVWEQCLMETAAGWSERALGLLQALLEHNVLAPSSTAQQLQEFWDSEEPRVGDDDPRCAGMALWLREQQQEQQQQQQRALKSRLLMIEQQQQQSEADADTEVADGTGATAAGATAASASDSGITSGSTMQQPHAAAVAPTAAAAESDSDAEEHRPQRSQRAAGKSRWRSRAADFFTSLGDDESEAVQVVVTTPAAATAADAATTAGGATGAAQGRARNAAQQLESAYKAAMEATALAAQREADDAAAAAAAALDDSYDDERTLADMITAGGSDDERNHDAAAASTAAAGAGAVDAVAAAMTSPSIDTSATTTAVAVVVESSSRSSSSSRATEKQQHRSDDRHSKSKRAKHNDASKSRSKSSSKSCSKVKSATHGAEGLLWVNEAEGTAYSIQHGHRISISSAPTSSALAYGRALASVRGDTATAGGLPDTEEAAEHLISSAVQQQQQRRSRPRRDRRAEELLREASVLSPVPADDAYSAWAAVEERLAAAQWQPLRACTAPTAAEAAPDRVVFLEDLQPSLFKLSSISTTAAAATGSGATAAADSSLAVVPAPAPAAVALAAPAVAALTAWECTSPVQLPHMPPQL
jgi:NRDE-2, necessary for RNA interference